MLSQGRFLTPLPLPVVQSVTLRCVWASHPDNDRHCHARIPLSVVAEAWWREREEGHVEEGFFRFLWNGREWLGYGLQDGRVRGVYCPIHSAERDGRAPRARQPPRGDQGGTMGAGSLMLVE